jgi:hypothetical protein
VTPEQSSEEPGQIDLTDDRPVEDDTLLYRRVHKVHYSRRPDGSFRLRETAFKNFPGGGLDMSVQLGDRLAELAKSPEDVLKGHDSTFGLAALRTKVVRDEEQSVERTPKPDDLAHGDVIGEKPTGRRKRFAAAAWWAVEPQPSDSA